MLLRSLALVALALPLFCCAGVATAPRPAAPLALNFLDMPIEQIAATQKGCAILDRDFPGLRAHPMYAYFKAMTLNQIAAMSHGQITPAMLTKARADLSTPGAVTQVSATAP